MEYCKYTKLGSHRIIVKTGITTLKRQVSGPLQKQEDHEAPGSIILRAAVI